MADIDNVTVGENNYNLRDTPARNAMPTQGQVDDIIEALDIIAAKSNTPYNASNKLPTDYADDTNQTHKFATAAQLSQIETNKTNISLNFNREGFKNLSTVYSGTCTGSDFPIGVTPITLPQGTYVVSFNSTTTTSTGSLNFYNSSGTAITSQSVTFSLASQVVKEFSITVDTVAKFSVYSNVGTTISNFMICTKADWENSQMFEKHALSNADLTTATKQNEANILFVAENGATNYVPVATDSYNLHGITATTSNGEITISGTADYTFSLYIVGKFADDLAGMNKITSKLPDVIAFTGAPNTDNKNRLIFALYNGSTWVYSGSTNDLYHDITGKTYTHWFVYLPIVSGNSYNGVWKPMIVPKSLYDAGFTTYQPYALSNVDLTTAVSSFGYKTKEITLSSLNFLQATGGLFYTSSLLDCSSEFDEIYSVNLNGFNNLGGNWAIMFSVKPGTASYGIVIQDPTNPATLTVGSAVIRVLIFGKLKQS